MGVHAGIGYLLGVAGCYRGILTYVTACCRVFRYVLFWEYTRVLSITGAYLRVRGDIRCYRGILANIRFGMSYSGGTRGY